jgi:hypothetical protein
LLIRGRQTSFCGSNRVGQQHGDGVIRCDLVSDRFVVTMYFMMFHLKRMWVVAGLGVMLTASIGLTACGSSKLARVSLSTSTKQTPETSNTLRPLGSIGTRASSIDGQAVDVTLNEVKRQGNYVAVTYTATAKPNNSAPADMVFAFGRTLLSFDGVTVVDTQNGKMYTPAFDSEQDCLCSYEGVDQRLSLAPGKSLIFSAITGAPPADVRTVDVMIQGAGTFSGIQLA